MTVTKISNGDETVLHVEGRLDTVTAPVLEAEIKALEGVKTLILDFKELKYVSSAGLRVVLMAQKIMAKQGSMIIKNANETVMEVFEITGFSDILTFGA